MPSPSWNPRSNADRWRPAAGRSSPSSQTNRGAEGVPPLTLVASTAPIEDSGPARLGHGLVPLRAGIAAPRDPAADVERQPPSVGDERADQDARAHPAVRPEPEHRAAVRTAPDRLELLDQLHRADLRRAGDAAARERRREEVEGVDVRAQGCRSPSSRGAGRPPCARGAGAAARGRCRARRRGRGRCAARRRSSRSRPGPWGSRAAPVRAPGPAPASGRAGGCP